MMLGSGSEEEVKALSAIEGLPFSGPVVLKGDEGDCMSVSFPHILILVVSKLV
jgi:hypothetical protein